VLVEEGRAHGDPGREMAAEETHGEKNVACDDVKWFQDKQNKTFIQNSTPLV
jgi:hypothetical protein